MFNGRFGKGYVPVPREVAKTSARSHFGAPARLPAEWDGLSDLVSPIHDERLDQKTTNMCVGFSLGVHIWLALTAIGIKIPLPSFPAIYFVARAFYRVRGIPLLDLGCNPEEAVLGVQKWGVPSMDEWSFDPAAVNDEPDVDVVLDMRDFRVPGSLYIDSSGAQAVADTRMALSQNHPVSIGSNVDRAFEDWRWDPANPSPIYAPDKGALLGGHMTLLTGYKVQPNGRTWFKMLNWWGLDWGGMYGFAWVDESWVEQASDRVVLLVQATGGRVRR